MTPDLEEDLDPVEQPQRPAIKPRFLSRPGMPSEIAEKFHSMFDLLDRLDTQIDACNDALNACQPPRNGKLGIRRDKPTRDSVAGYPRLVEWYRTSGGKWLCKSIGNNMLTRKAKSAPPFDRSYPYVLRVMTELNILFVTRKNLIEHMTNMNRILDSLSHTDTKICEAESVISEIQEDSFKMLESKWKL
jgi:hypothetical protein